MYAFLTVILNLQNHTKSMLSSKSMKIVQSNKGNIRIKAKPYSNTRQAKP